MYMSGSKAASSSFLLEQPPSFFFSCLLPKANAFKIAERTSWLLHSKGGKFPKNEQESFAKQETVVQDSKKQFCARWHSTVALTKFTPTKWAVSDTHERHNAGQSYEFSGKSHLRSFSIKTSFPISFRPLPHSTLTWDLSEGRERHCMGGKVSCHIEHTLTGFSHCIKIVPVKSHNDFSRPLVVWLNRNLSCQVRTNLHHDASTYDRFCDCKVVEVNFQVVSLASTLLDDCLATRSTAKKPARARPRLRIEFCVFTAAPNKQTPENKRKHPHMLLYSLHACNKKRMSEDQRTYFMNTKAACWHCCCFGVSGDLKVRQLLCLQSHLAEGICDVESQKWQIGLGV